MFDSANARLAGGPDSCVDVPLRPRGNVDELPSLEHLDGAPRDLAPQLREGEARRARQDQRGPIGAIRLLPLEAGWVEGRELNAARSLADHVRQQFEACRPATASGICRFSWPGGAAGHVAGGRYVRFPGDETPLTNLYLTMLDKVGVPTEKLGDSTGKLNRLEV